MDVMKPRLLWVDGACYRVNDSGLPSHDEDPEDFIREDEDLETEEIMTSAPIEEWKGKYRACLDIPSSLYGHLIGRKGNSLRLVQDNTGCKVNIPRGPRSKDSAVEVIGDQRRLVVRACNMLLMSADRGRQMLNASHFIGIRLCTQHVQNRFSTFQTEVLERCKHGGARSVTPELFQQSSRLHLTISMLTLLSETERHSLCQTLGNHAEELKRLVPDGGLAVRVRDLDTMSDDWSETRVLFAGVQEVDGSGALQRLADRCHQIAVASGLGKKEHDHVKLHCTLMNVSFLLKDMDESDPEFKRLKASTFDATPIMQEFGRFDFGTVRVERLEVLQRQSWADDGFYLPIGDVSLELGTGLKDPG